MIELKVRNEEIRNIDDPYEVLQDNLVYGKWIAEYVASNGFGVSTIILGNIFY